jgi:hypothetical protein
MFSSSAFTKSLKARPCANVYMKTDISQYILNNQPMMSTSTGTADYNGDYTS